LSPGHNVGPPSLRRLVAIPEPVESLTMRRHRPVKPPFADLKFRQKSLLECVVGRQRPRGPLHKQRPLSLPPTARSGPAHPARQESSPPPLTRTIPNRIFWLTPRANRCLKAAAFHLHFPFHAVVTRPMPHSITRTAIRYGPYQHSLAGFPSAPYLHKPHRAGVRIDLKRGNSKSLFAETPVLHLLSGYRQT